MNNDVEFVYSYFEDCKLDFWYNMTQNVYFNVGFCSPE